MRMPSTRSLAVKKSIGFHEDIPLKSEG
jgi:hypothetical protein